MKAPLRSLLFLMAFFPATIFAGEKSTSDAKNCGCECCIGREICCCQEPPASPEKPAAQRYPLKGIVIGVFTGKSALLVKHEEIPGFMRAMTMMFKVDAATLASAAEGQAITGTLIQRDKEFWLEDVKSVPAK